MAFMLLRRNSYIAAAVVAWAFAPVTAQARDAELTSVSVATLGRGDFLWDAARAVPGDVGIIVSIADQKLYVYRGEALVAVSAVSTGKPGYDT
ncbi:MAG: L,D-transpeptidase, partial [Sphingomonas sp.]